MLSGDLGLGRSGQGSNIKEMLMFCFELRLSQHHNSRALIIKNNGGSLNFIKRSTEQNIIYIKYFYINIVLKASCLPNAYKEIQKCSMIINQIVYSWC